MPLKQGRQSSCLHGSTTGSTKISKQIGQVQSDMLKFRVGDDPLRWIATSGFFAKATPSADLLVDFINGFDLCKLLPRFNKDIVSLYCNTNKKNSL